MVTQDKRVDVAVVIGRFQPYHAGHAPLLAAAFDAAENVVVVLGSSFHARSVKNPFTWQERVAMMKSALSEEQRARVQFAAVRDYYDDGRWAQAVQIKVKALQPEAQRFTLVGHFKDASSYYLSRFPHWNLLEIDNTTQIDATAIRRILFEAEDLEVSLSVLENMLSLPVRQYLKAWCTLPAYSALVEEYRGLQKYKAAWAAAPYPPIFCTVDSVVRTNQHVLLIQRGGFPGKGLWALPGGFLDPHERLQRAAVRELREETKLAVLDSTLENALVDVKVFDHPERSQRGRTITHAFYFDLKLDHFPDIEADDDAAAAKWLAIDDIVAMEDQFFDDHFHILDHFLQLS
jgi:bifunctional NMN adenylyltransferase/nudix hydrolase